MSRDWREIDTIAQMIRDGLPRRDRLSLVINLCNGDQLGAGECYQIIDDTLKADEFPRLAEMLLRASGLHPTTTEMTETPQAGE